MSYLPCENPSCKSYGKPHPNCRCHGEFAEGGEITFCSKNRMHQSNCEYFADGGQVNNDIPEGFQVENQPTAQPQASNEIPEGFQIAHDDLPAGFQIEPQTDYESIPQQILTGVEGLGRGVLGPIEAAISKVGQYVAPGLEESLSLRPEDIAARQEANPTIATGTQVAGTIGSLASGAGVPGLIAKGSLKAAQALDLGAVGTGAIAAALNNGLLQGSDEITKGLLGQGDTTHPVGSALANIGGSALLGIPFGVAGGLFANKLSSAAENAYGNKIAEFVKGFGASSQGQDLPENASRAFKVGTRAYQAMHTGLDAFGTLEGAKAGYDRDGLMGAIEGAFFGGASSHEVQKFAMPIILRLISSGNVDKLGEALDYGNNVNSGAQKITRGITNLFSDTAQKAYEGTRQGKDIKDYLEKGGLQQDVDQTQIDQNHMQTPKLAKGGEVKRLPIASDDGSNVLDHSHLGQALPEQHLAIQIAKGRVNHYLRSLQPSSQLTPKLPFDPEPDTTQQKRSFDRAIKIAAEPLHILNEVKQGTLEKEDIQHLATMYPEIHQILQQKMHTKIAEAQLKDKTPPYQLRQSLAMFLGQPLSSEQSQPYIQAAQNTFVMQKQAQTGPSQQAPGQKNKKGTSSLSKISQNFMTDEQARIVASHKA